MKRFATVGAVTLGLWLLLAAPALAMALERRGMAASELDAIIVATITPDHVFPATACLVQDRLGAVNAFGFDLSAACSGFLCGLTTGASLVAGGAEVAWTPLLGVSAVVLAVVIGALASLYPALHAGKLDPTEALRAL